MLIINTNVNLNTENDKKKKNPVKQYLWTKIASNTNLT